MQFASSVTVLLALMSSCHAEVTLVKGVNQTVAFDGDALLMEYNNPQGQFEGLGLCLGSSAGTGIVCPQGYAGIVLTSVPRETYKLSRKGVLTWSAGGRFPVSGVQFGDDGTINVLITGMAASATVTLPDAHIMTSSTTTTTVAPTKVTSTKTVLLALLVTISIFVVVTTGIIAWYFCFCRRKKDQTVEVPKDQPISIRPASTQGSISDSQHR